MIAAVADRGRTEAKTGDGEAGSEKEKQQTGENQHDGRTLWSLRQGNTEKHDAKQSGCPAS